MGNADEGTSSAAAAANTAAAAGAAAGGASSSSVPGSYPAPAAGPDGYPPQQQFAPYPGAHAQPPAPGTYPGQQQMPYPPAGAQPYPPGQPSYAPYPGQPGYAHGQPGYAPPPPAVVQGRPPLISIVSPEDARKIRKMQWINFACTMLQLACSVAIILIIRNNLTRIIVGTPTSGSALFWDYECYAATSKHPSTCEYGISLASVSIFFGFILSLMQCLTMDCCGMGRAVEAGFDAAACAWWIAGAITMGIRAGEANAAGVPQGAARNAVVALCWISAFMFGALLVTNLILIKRLGRAYKAAAQQMQQHMTAYPTGHGVQMTPMHPMQAGGPVAVTGGAAFPGQPQAVQPQGPPAGYPTQFTPPPAQAAAPGIAPTGPNAV